MRKQSGTRKGKAEQASGPGEREGREAGTATRKAMQSGILKSTGSFDRRKAAGTGKTGKLYGAELIKPAIITVTWHKPEATATGKWKGTHPTGWVPFGFC